ncbi:hypothetical protein CVT24_009789 [Panaeolus cyanescens]|uniref:Uncharacterized protein n=1 Tax=Panaeolus cyanescens TaxID=181874 RepID=A0A409VCM0_9AGAR|nr:hypothetical protein CVT24_009789 [Panaeolus cyanescens]
MSNSSSMALKPKVTVKLNYKSSPNSVYASSSRPGSPSKVSATNSRLEPVSPTNTNVSMNSHASTNFRPRAKVNSSATTRKVAATNSATATPRAASPNKLTPRIRSTVTSPTTGPKAPGFRPRTPVSTPATPELRSRVLPSNSPNDLPEITRTRSGSSSLHHAASFSAFPARNSADSDDVSISPIPSRLQPSKSVLGLSDRDNTDPPPLRIRSKVSNLAKSFTDGNGNTNVPTSSPPQLRPGTSPRTRTASISSNVSAPPNPTSPPPQFYPITTSSPAANPHRFASARSPPPRTNYALPQNLYQPFNNTSDDTILRPKARITATTSAKVDPVSIPLPPHSPPASAVSFSSRSSVSRSSASVSHLAEPQTSSSGLSSGRLSPTTQQASTSTDQLRSTLDTLLQYTSTLDEVGRESGHDQDSDAEPEENEEHKVKAAAKSNRKIADLEITNRSLLAINASLEETKHRQAKEIRDLRRKLRESRLILPPKAYRAVKSSLDPEELADDEDLEEDDGESEDEDVDDGDETYKRIKIVLDNLLKTGQMALQTNVSDFREGGKGGAKVLTAQEVRSWRGLEEDNDTDSLFERPPGSKPETTSALDDSFSEVGDQTMTSEDEVEAMTVFSRSPPHSPPPPILITQPT